MVTMSRAGEQDRTGRRVLRWVLWAAAGIAAGLLIGFAAGLSAPRQNPGDADAAEVDTTDADSAATDGGGAG